MRIVQIAPYIHTGSGVAGVAANLEREFRALGHTVERFTLEDALRGKSFRERRSVPMRAFALFRQMVWFTVIGTARAKEYLAERPDAVSICHNNVMTGDVYVDHGVVSAAMRARGNGAWRMVRNPTHLFTFARDLVRYRGRAHRAVVALSPAQVEVLRRTYGKVRPPVVVIPNGVDLERFRPPTAEERRNARAQFRLDDEDRVVLFVGHEFERKGLPLAIDALAHATTVLMLVAGGNQQSIADARAHAEAAGVADRVLFMGPRGDDLPLFFAASDIFALPSAYEANALVVLEALAAGVPVVATRVGYAPDVIVDGENGFLVDRDPIELAARFEQLAAIDLAPLREAARRSAEAHSWRASAQRYVELLADLRPDLDRTAP
ncbi:hypothetical protein LK09_03320 [Microbacterium mangrovi]|uniref:Uncharacterized protein n=1 Tax=Microbacterium mangrovi TaxID=1348253 RepID=A0A0B2A751_9MICO|nr:glycosyltransferase family 4 protein [Microbacterium mangrovi]KHK99319.1 hypothetical protein LK09_03320 [Microbacterium mangrovi]